MKVRSLFIVAFCAKAFMSCAGDTNFVAAFDTQWRAHDASNILTYVETQIATNRNVEVLFARGIVAAYLQKWGRGATNYFGQAIATAQSNTCYSASGRSNLVNIISNVNGHFAALAEDVGEPNNSIPSWDTNVHAVLFGELGDQAPFLSILNDISIIQ